MSEILLPHGGFEDLKSFQLARLIFDITARFAEMYIDAKSRTRDQMTQAARSGGQNIAEGSEAASRGRMAPPGRRQPAARQN